MNRRLRYHVAVRRSTPASVALFAAVALATVFLPAACAQISTGQASTSAPASGMGSHAGSFVPGVAPHTSNIVVVPPTGPVVPRTGTVPLPSLPNRGVAHTHHPRHDHDFVGFGLYPYAYPVPVPYQPDEAQGAGDDSEDDADYQGGPTVFDRRGSGADSYVPPLKDVPSPHSDQPADAYPPAPESPQEPTVLVFKDGEKLEVGNYAIVGATLFDLSPGHHRKIMLADLDLDATQKLNDDRGVIFQLPASSQAN